MTTHPHILCPVDFTESSRTALAYAAVIAEHFGATLDVLAVDDPLLAEVAAATAGVSLRDETAAELQRFCEGTFQRPLHSAGSTTYHVATGKPAIEILRFARELPADLLVMGSHGRSGISRVFFGSTAERVLRDTVVPVLVTADGLKRPGSLTEAAAAIARVLAPVDFSSGSPRQASIACGIASALSASLLIAHALEPVFVPAALRAAVTGIDAERRAAAESRLAALAAGQTGCRAEPIVVSGDAAEEMVKLAAARDVGLIVLGLHSGEPAGHRMGSVAYRVLCQARRLVLALPPGAHT